MTAAIPTKTDAQRILCLPAGEKKGREVFNPGGSIATDLRGREWLTLPVRGFRREV